MAEAKKKPSREDQKHHAYTLFVNTAMTQKDIAEKVGVSAQTMTKWANDGKWEQQKKSLTTTRAEQLALLYEILAKLNAEAKAALDDDDPDTNPDADAIIKITAAIKNLEKEAGIGEMIATGLAFLKFMQKQDLHDAKIINKWFFIFIQDKMAESEKR
jgi:DNA-binding XRE family transcriptional regulator